MEEHGDRRIGGKFDRSRRVTRNFGAQTHMVGQDDAVRCNKCKFLHRGNCVICQRCHLGGHMAKDCRKRLCFDCGSPDHIRIVCPKRKAGANANQTRQISSGNSGSQARGRAFELGVREAREDPNVVSEAFVIEFANGQEFKARSVFTNCTLNLANKDFSIDLIPIELGRFDIIVGMDWLSKNQAEIVCSEKLIRIPQDGMEQIVVQGDKLDRRIKLVSCMKMQKYLKKIYTAYLAHVVDGKIKEKSIEELPVVRDFSNVFPKDLPGLPPQRQVEFGIDLIPEVAPVARAPYRLAPSEMQEMSTQLQELLERGFIRP
ncbi:uncharacterized protein LOC112505146, partial [Cynara cardunculus var. scolymus]|uniref:uncharacterized protein LOC112505146 n=1 Tax=Cynara cardunculus var. scolymus TaxID=59895 RepID=UPI000D62A853